MRQVRGISHCRMRNAEWRAVESIVMPIANTGSAEQGHKSFYVVISCSFIDRNPNGSDVERTQVAPGASSPVDEIDRRRLAKFDPNGVEEILMYDAQSELLQSGCQCRGRVVHPFGNPPETTWTVVDRVHR